MKAVFKQADVYQKPICQIVEVMQEGLLCTSGTQENDYNSTLDDYVVKDESYW